jgi:peptidylprolyl isomerase
MSKAKNGDYVQIHYTGTLDDGTVFDSSVDRPPLEFQVGGGQVIPGFNNAVLGMEVDTKKTFTLSPEEAYGELREDMKRDFPKSMLGDHQIQVGQMLRFSSPQGPVPGTVLAIGADNFTVDFNHPLAGKSLTFKITLVGVSDAPTQMQMGCSCSSSTCSPGECGP